MQRNAIKILNAGIQDNSQESTKSHARAKKKEIWVDLNPAACKNQIDRNEKLNMIGGVEREIV